MEKILGHIHKIKTMSGFNSKRDFILNLKKSGAFNKELEYLLRFIIDPNITTGISDKKLNKPMDCLDSDFTFIEILKWLEINNTGRDEDVATVKGFIEKNKEFEDILSEVFTKKIKIGLSPKTINKIIPNFIECVEFMKAKNYMDRYVSNKFNFNKEYQVSEKIDGIRCAFIKKNSNDIKAYSRQGKEIIGLVEIKEAFKSDLFPIGVYDGELLSLKSFDTDENKFQYTLSIVNSKATVKKDLEFIVFDFIDIDNFFSGFSGTPFRDRIKVVNNIIKEYRTKGKLYINSLLNKQYYEVGKFAHEEFIDIVNKCDIDGKEGVMINDLDAPYKAGRVDGILKLKKVLVADVRIEGFEIGDGKNRNKLGALIISFDYGGFKNICKIGTGFNDEEREFFWNNQDDYIGKIIEVTYQKITKNKDNDFYSLGFASYNHRIRDDKTETSIY